MGDFVIATQRLPSAMLYLTLQLHASVPLDKQHVPCSDFSQAATLCRITTANFITCAVESCDYLSHLRSVS